MHQWHRRDPRSRAPAQLRWSRHRRHAELDHEGRHPRGRLRLRVPLVRDLVQSALGIPVSLFTGIFAMARTVGWIAQWNEMISDPEQKIGRPRQLFVGAPKRDVAPIAKR